MLRAMQTDDDLARPFLTPRLRLRRLQPGDLEAFAAVRGDAELGRYQGWTPMDRAAALDFITQMQAAPAFAVGDWLQLAIAERDSDQLIGDLGVLRHDATTAELGFTLSRAAQGRGLAREAVAGVVELLRERLGLRRVRGVTDARNTASARLMQALGWRQVASVDTVFRGEACTEWTFEKDW